MTQGSLDFADTHARRSDPETSRQAARSMAIPAEAQRREILWAILRAKQPETAEEIAVRCAGLDKVQVERRMVDLVRDGHVVEVDQEGRTSTGRAATRDRLREVA